MIQEGSPANADTAAALVRISAQLAVVIELLSSSSGGKSLSKTDRTALALLLPLIVTRYGGESVFSSADAIEYATGFPDAEAALKQAIGTELSARRMGKLLSRAHNTDIGGLRVLRMHAERDGCLWVVRRV